MEKSGCLSSVSVADSRQLQDTNFHRALRCRADVEDKLLEVVPRQYAAEIEEEAARDSLRQLQSERLSLSSGVIESTYIGPTEAAPRYAGSRQPLLRYGHAWINTLRDKIAFSRAETGSITSFMPVGRTPVLLLHGFDCSCLGEALQS